MVLAIYFLATEIVLIGSLGVVRKVQTDLCYFQGMEDCLVLRDAMARNPDDLGEYLYIIFIILYLLYYIYISGRIVSWRQNV